MTTYFRNGRQAPTTYDLGGAQAPRPKGLFYVRFKKGAGGSENQSDWQRGIGFLVKAMDQPKVQPKTEEVTQYNKKRQIYTGYVTQPVTVTFYDTADGMATRMWDEYSRYYFGDFNQEVSNYNYDIVSFDSPMLGGEAGYGYTPRSGLSDELDINSQFFFQSVEIFQVFRNAFTRVYLVNPKITSFDPEDLDYENMNALTIRTTLSYEAVIYDNGGAPQPISSDPELAEAFADIRLHGDIIEVSGTPGQPISQSGTRAPSRNAAGGIGGFLGGIFGGSNNITSTLSNVLGGRGPSSGIGGVLGSFGNFNFGNAAGVLARSVISGDTRNLGSELTYAATGSTLLTSVVAMSQNGFDARTLLGQVQAATPGINPMVYDIANAAIAASDGNRAQAGVLGERLVRGLLTASASQPGSTPADHVSSSNGGMVFSQTAYNAINSVRNTVSQIGVNLGNAVASIPPPPPPAPPEPGQVIPPL